MTSSPERTGFDMLHPGGAAALRRVMAAHWSCRAFTGEPVPDETITAILETAQLSASWCNSQPWQLAIANGEGTLIGCAARCAPRRANAIRRLRTSRGPGSTAGCIGTAGGRAVFNSTTR